MSRETSLISLFSSSRWGPETLTTHEFTTNLDGINGRDKFLQDWVVKMDSTAATATAINVSY